MSLFKRGKEETTSSTTSSSDVETQSKFDTYTTGPGLMEMLRTGNHYIEHDGNITAEDFQDQLRSIQQNALVRSLGDYYTTLSSASFEILDFGQDPKDQAKETNIKRLNSVLSILDKISKKDNDERT